MSVRGLVSVTLLTLGVSLIPSLAAPLAAQAGDPQLGERLYRDGLLASGEPISATLDAARVSGSAFHCQACHRRSGYGSLEGAVPSPAVVGDVLFAPRRLDRAELHRQLFLEVQADPFTSRARDPRLRPAYDDSSLGTVLREGVDPAGRMLTSWMPRYDVGDEDVANLAAYLRQLGAVPDPGVEPEKIHFATVVAPGVDASMRRAFLDVMEAYVARKNAEVQGLLRHPNRASWHREPFRDAWREWRLHVWELEGPPPSWTEQLHKLYEQRPVFAVLAGLVPDSFEPVHRFCEREAVPCLFPHTDLPVTETQGDYTLYLSQGLVGEARALAVHLQSDSADPHVWQIYRETERSSGPARAFEAAWSGELEELVLGADEPLDWQVIETIDADAVVIWLEARDLPEFRAVQSVAAERVYVSSTLVGVAPAFGPGVGLGSISKLLLTHRFALPGEEVPRIYRVRAWLCSRGVASADHERLQLDTFFALTAADHGLNHLVTRYDRDFFVESVEHETESALNPGSYPRLSLGPGQRFASKGCWVVRVGETGLEPVGDWIVP